jgi:integrase
MSSGVGRHLCWRATTRALLAGIGATTLIGLRDRAFIGLMAYSFARVGAAVAMRVQDFHPVERRWWVRLHEKGGKLHELPAHHNLEAWLHDYMEAAGIGADRSGWLFRAAIGRTGVLSDRQLLARNAIDLVRRRVRGAGLPTTICCHSFRATGITAYLENGGSLEMAQAIAAHENPRTTKFPLNNVMRLQHRLCSGLAWSRDLPHEAHLHVLEPHRTCVKRNAARRC